METEYIEETTTDVTETEAVVEETSAENTDNSASDTSIDGSANVEGIASDPVTEQSEETGSEATPDTVGGETTYTQEELEQVVSAVLANEEETAELEVMEETEEVPRTLFNTPLEEYSVSEGLLVCIFLLLLANFINSIFKGSHWFGKL